MATISNCLRRFLPVPGRKKIFLLVIFLSSLTFTLYFRMRSLETVLRGFEGLAPKIASQDVIKTHPGGSFEFKMNEEARQPEKEIKSELDMQPEKAPAKGTSEEKRAEDAEVLVRDGEQAIQKEAAVDSSDGQPQVRQQVPQTQPVAQPQVPQTQPVVQPQQVQNPQPVEHPLQESQVQSQLQSQPNIESQTKVQPQAQQGPQHEHSPDQAAKAPQAQSVNDKPSFKQYCSVHNFSMYIPTDDPTEFECLATKTVPSAMICLYPNAADMYVSKEIRDSGGWEKMLNLAIIAALKKYPNAAFIDIGSNIGMHSLVAAKLGRKVVAVEPQMSSIKRQHKSVKLNNFEKNYILIENGISDNRTSLSITIKAADKSGSFLSDTFVDKGQTVRTILMNDLLEVIDFNETIIKMDIESYECKALARSKQLFTSLNVRALFIDWVAMKLVLVNKPQSNEARLVKDTVSYLRFLGFQPKPIDPAFSFVNKPQLEDSQMMYWPDNLVWIK